MAAENYLSSQMGSRSANSEQPCAVQRDCVHCCPSPHAESGLRAGRPVCQERGAGCTCVRQACSRHVQGSRGCGGRSVRKDGKTALAPAAVADARDAALVLAVRRRQAGATQMALLLRGLPAQRHRSASLVEEEPHPERHRSSTYRGVLEVLPWSRRCVPVKKSCSSR